MPTPANDAPFDCASAILPIWRRSNGVLYLICAPVCVCMHLHCETSIVRRTAEGALEPGVRSIARMRFPPPRLLPSSSLTATASNLAIARIPPHAHTHTTQFLRPTLPAHHLRHRPYMTTTTDVNASIGVCYNNKPTPPKSKFARRRAINHIVSRLPGTEPAQPQTTTHEHWETRSPSLPPH